MTEKKLVETYGPCMDEVPKYVKKGMKKTMRRRICILSSLCVAMTCGLVSCINDGDSAEALFFLFMSAISFWYVATAVSDMRRGGCCWEATVLSCEKTGPRHSDNPDVVSAYIVYLRFPNGHAERIRFDFSGGRCLKPGTKLYVFEKASASDAHVSRTVCFTEKERELREEKRRRRKRKKRKI